MEVKQIICPCGTKKVYPRCCEVYHLRKSSPATAEALMRARYAAYVFKRIDFLLETTLPASRHASLKDGYRSTAESISWISLEVLQTSQGLEKDKRGKVEFKATFLQDGQRSIHHEVSRFRRHRGDWMYVDGLVAAS